MTVIKIKRGPGAPTTSALTSFEPGFSTDNENLYINNAGSMVRIGHKTYTGSSAPDSSLGENGDFYTQLTTSSSSVTTSNDFLQKVDGEWLSVGGGGGGNADYIELTQAEYNQLTPEEKNNGKMYFITDASSQSLEAKLEDLDNVIITSPSDGDVLTYVAASSLWVNEPSAKPVLTTYSGTTMSPATGGVCTLQKIDFGTFDMYKFEGWFKANGTIPTGTEYTPLFQFETGAIPTNFGTALAFGEDNGFFFCRMTTRPSNDTAGVFYGTRADKYYNWNQVYIIPKS